MTPKYSLLLNMTIDDINSVLSEITSTQIQTLIILTMVIDQRTLERYIPITLYFIN